MTYKGYVAEIMFDDKAEVFHGQVKNIQDVITFEGQSVDELRREFEVSVDEYLDMCREMNEDPERPFSGRFVVRIDPDLHRDASLCAMRQRVSLNALVADAIRYRVNLGFDQPGAATWGYRGATTTPPATDIPDDHENQEVVRLAAVH